MLGGKKLGNKKSKKRKSLEDKTARELVKEADKWWSKYIRLRDSVINEDGDWVGTCVDCPKRLIVYSGGKWNIGAQCGHFISRGVFALRWDERNTNLQSAYCNAWKDKDAMLRGYAQTLDKLYGKGTADELRELADQPGAYTLPPKQTLLDLINKYKEYVETALTQP